MAKYIGHITYLSLLALSIYFYLERTVFLDIAYHLFSILKNNDFAIQNFRIGSAFTQSFPLLLGKLGAPLKLICILYSCSFILLYYLAYLLINHVIKNLKVANCLLLFSVFMVTHTFFWIQSELPQGIAITMIYFAVFQKQLKGNSTKWFHLPFYALSIFTIAFTHPLLLFLMMFIFAFLYLSERKHLKYISAHFFTFLGILVLKKLFFSTEYDSQAMGGLSNIVHKFPNYFTIQSNVDFISSAFYHYHFLIIALVGVLYFYLKKLDYLKLLLVASFFFGYLFLVNISYADGAEKFYLENQYLLLSLFVSIPLVFDVLPAVSKFKWTKYLIPLICFACLVRILLVSQEYSNRVNWFEKYSNELALHQEKQIIKTGNLPMGLLKMTWAAEYEFWLISTLNHKESQSVIIEGFEGEFEKQKNISNAFITRWGDFSYKHLNPKYFRFKNTSPYNETKLPAKFSKE